MPKLARWFALPFFLFVTAPLSPGQSSLVGVDQNALRLIRTSEASFGATLVPGEPTDIEPVAIDLDRGARLLQCVRLDEANGRYILGFIELETGELARHERRVLHDYEGEVLDISVAPVERATYIASILAQDLSIWKMLDEEYTPTLVATLPGFGRAGGIAIARDGRILVLRESTRELVEIDLQGNPRVIGATGLLSGTTSGLDVDWTTGDLVTVVQSATTVPRVTKIDPNTGRATFVSALDLGSRVRVVVQRSHTELQPPSVCGPAIPNSTGLPGRLTAIGQQDITRNDLVLAVGNLPPGSFGLLLASTEVAAPAQPMGSAGNLCLGGAIGRLTGPSGLFPTGADGSFESVVDLGAIPSPIGAFALEAWFPIYFQAWFRDASAGMGTSNFSDAVELSFGQAIEGPKLGTPRLGVGYVVDFELGDLRSVGSAQVLAARESSIHSYEASNSGWLREDWFFDYTTLGGLVASELELGDLDGDGRVDLALSIKMGSSGAVFWNDGDGPASPAVQLQACGVTLELEVSDLDVDGFDDIILPCLGSDQFAVYWGDSSRVFTQSFQPGPSRGDSQLLVTDVSGDGLEDLVIHQFSTLTLHVMVNLGNRTFAPPQSIALGVDVGHMDAANMNQDGIVDLVLGVPYVDPPDVLMLDGLGGGAFAAPTSHALPVPWIAMLVHDADRDGAPDLIITSVDDSLNQLHWLRNDGVGGLALEKTGVGGYVPTGLAVGDLTGDGEEELVMLGLDRDEFFVVSADPEEWKPTPLITSLGTDARQIETGEFGGSSAPDLAILSALPPSVTISLGIGNGQFSDQGFYGFQSEAFTIATADFDGDGDADIVGLSYAGLVEFAANDGTGALSFMGLIDLPHEGRKLRAVDMNGDGLAEVAVVTSARQLLVFENLGGFQFGPGLDLSGAVDVERVEFGDLDLDGDPDAVVVVPGTGGYTLLGRPGVALAPPMGLHANTFSVGHIGDIDGDGIPDIYGNILGGRLLLGRGDGFFETGLTQWRGPVLGGADLDGDGRAELLAHRSSRARHLISRLGRTSLVAEEFISFGKGLVFDELMIDANNDGRLDLIVLTRSNGNAWLEVVLTSD